jgi:ABC-type lipoprotein release transport system permease subunit
VGITPDEREPYPDDVRIRSQLVAFTIIAVIVGVLAAIVPARRAAKLNVLRALQYE